MRKRQPPEAAQAEPQWSHHVVEPRHLRLPTRDRRQAYIPPKPTTVLGQRRFPHAPRWMVLGIVGLLLLGGSLSGLALFLGWLPLPFAEQSQQLLVTDQPEGTGMNGAALVLVEGTAQRFTDAMLRKDWAALWTMLHPGARQDWQGVRDFVHFEQVKFGALTFVGAHMSSTRIEHSWRDPDTTTVYTTVVTLGVSLQATAPKDVLSAPSILALEHGLFNNTLLVLAQNHGTWQVLVAGPVDLEAPVLVPASPPARKLTVPLFMYHHVSHLPQKDLLDYNLTVTTADFGQQLNWLQKEGYQSISETELFAALYDGKVLPAHPMMLTFDDGYEDMFTDALPVLLAHHDRGVFYIITGLIGGDYLTWDQILALARDGMQIASHTVHHVNVGNPPRGTSTQAELLLSKQTLQEQLGQPVQFFCYPVGEPFHHDSMTQQRAVLADLFNDGYVGATLDPFSFFSAVQSAQLPYQLNRIRVSGGESLSAFSGILEVTLTSAGAWSS